MMIKWCPFPEFSGNGFFMFCQIVYEDSGCTEFTFPFFNNTFEVQQQQQSWAGIGLNKKSPVILGIKTNNHETQINEIIKPQMY